MMNDALLILLAILAILALFILGAKNLEVSHKRAQYLQALFAVAAFVTTAYWFFVERKGMPHADVTQTVEVVPLGSGLVAVEAHIQIKNLGERLLKVDHVNSRLQLVRADAYDYAGLAAKKGDDYWQAKRKKGEDQFSVAELRWPQLRQYDAPVDYRIEPGETDLVVVSFLMKCSAAPWVRVATDIHKPNGHPPPADGEQAFNNAEEFFWKTRTFADVGTVCAEAGKEGDDDEES